MFRSLRPQLSLSSALIRPSITSSFRTTSRQFKSSTIQLKLFGKSKHESKPIVNNHINSVTQPDANSTTIEQPTSARDDTQQKGVTEQDFKTHPILKRVPKFLRNYASKFVNAPFSHLIAFIVLHEMTAIVPLFGIWYYLHQHPGYIPLDLPQWAISKGAKVMDSMMGKIDWNLNTADKFSVIVEGAYAFTIVKFLLPIRIVISLYFMPWFARWFVLPITNLFKNMREIRKTKKLQKKSKGLNESELKKIDKPRL
ncbi:uncharacterized protein KGF55_001710 [Candida pseudojiufengensis]|uniref:uncharacterized protein n=1 Tax=Candida pseudojiufengensis TaxID=497109 RepID=UPI00222540E8|nr:uncharacterized protein KGF55_001710 [Candida pseudojiufengensis]KAI5964641.1 hypothetical protein KGF55_001710 [Candida pseudojiufengensis]